MSCKDPADRRRIVPVELPDDQVEILRGELVDWLAGTEGELERPGRSSDPATLIREAEAFRRLLAALDERRIALPDEEARDTMARAADGHDETVGYERVVAVHDAHRALLDVLGGACPGRRCPR